MDTFWRRLEPHLTNAIYKKKNTFNREKKHF